MENVWIVNHGYYIERSYISLFGSYEEAYHFVTETIKEYEEDYDEIEAWHESLNEDGTIREIFNDHEYYEIYAYRVEGKTDYVKRLEAALLYNFPGGDIEKILESIEKNS